MTALTILIINVVVTLIIIDTIFFLISTHTFNISRRDIYLGHLPFGGIWLFVKYLKQKL